MTVATTIAATERQDRLAAAIQELPQAVALFDAADRLVFWNRAYEQGCPGFTHLLQPGTPFTTLLQASVMIDSANQSPAMMAAAVERRLAFHRNPVGCIERRWLDGSWQEVREYRMPDGAWMAMATDITERKRTEEAMRRSEQRLSLHLEHTPVASIEWDTESRVVAWNRAAEQIFGFSREEMLGHRSRDLIVPERIRAQVDPMLNQLQQGKGGTRITNENVTKDGRTIVCDWYNTTLVDDQGQVIGTAALVQDITARLATEAELRRAKEAAEASDRAKSAFLANMSHELRTPLNAIIGFSEVIAQGLMGPVGTPQYVDYAQDINASGRHLLQIINDLLDLSKIEAGKFELNESVVSLGQVIAGCLSMLRGRAAESGLACAATVPIELPPVRADERALTQVLLNLLSNAIKFTSEGGVAVEAWREADGGIAIAVKDTGVGIRPEDVPRALAPFSQVDNELSRRHDGTGLGLPLARQLIELHGGRLALDSEPGQGTTVTVRLPPSRVLGG